jgi:hypothetical protein
MANYGATMIARATAAVGRRPWQRCTQLQQPSARSGRQPPRYPGQHVPAGTTRPRGLVFVVTGQRERHG